MNQMTFLIIMTVILTVISIILITVLVLMLRFISIFLKRKKNFLDIDIFEFNKSGLQVRHEIGRPEFHPDHGKIFVTCGKKKDSIKDNLGNHISDNDIIPSKSNSFLDFGTARKYLAAGCKDGVFAPLNVFENIVELSDSEKKELDEIKSKFGNIAKKHKISASFDYNPISFSLRPITPEQTRFILDVNKELQEKYLKDDFLELAKSMVKSIVPVFIVGFLMILIIVIVLIMQGGGLSQAVASARAAGPV